MDFYLNIATITKAINDYNNKHQILSEQKDYVVSSVNWLVGIGWSGEAKDKFLEVFQEKMKLYDKLLEDIQYMINALEEEKQRALMLKMRCEDFVNCIERSAEGGSITGNDEGIISLDFSSQSPINNYINNCTNEDYVNLNKNFAEIDDILGGLEYTSFGISGEVDSLKTSVKDQTESLTEFAGSFNVYYAGVKDMESNICSVFSKISGVSGGVFKNSSIISPSGDIDKNQLKDVLLKSEDGLTDEDKASLDYLEKVLGDDEYNKLKNAMLKNPEDLTDEEKQLLNNIKNIYNAGELNADIKDESKTKQYLMDTILKDDDSLSDEEKSYVENLKSKIGEDEYNKLKEYYEVLKLKEKGKSGEYWNNYYNGEKAHPGDVGYEYIYDVNVADSYENYVMTCNSEGKTPIDIEEYVNNMGAVWEYSYNHKTTDQRIEDLGTAMCVSLSMVDPLFILGDAELLTKEETDYQVLADKAQKEVDTVETDYETKIDAIIDEVDSNEKANVEKVEEESNSNVDYENQGPYSSSEWNDYLKNKYGSDNVKWETSVLRTGTRFGEPISDSADEIANIQQKADSAAGAKIDKANELGSSQFRNVHDVTSFEESIPSDASVEPWRPSDTIAEGHDRYVWTDSSGNKWFAEAHGVDSNSIAGSNSSTGWVYRVSVKIDGTGKPFYLASDGKFYSDKIFNINSPFYDENVANATHIPING